MPGDIDSANKKEFQMFDKAKKTRQVLSQRAASLDQDMAKLRDDVLKLSLAQHLFIAKQLLLMKSTGDQAKDLIASIASFAMAQWLLEDSQRKLDAITSSD